MTEAEFLALPPREQDALVAEKVMGWEFRAGNLVPPEEAVHIGKTGIVNDVYIQVPKFTQEISAAWEVVEKMRAERPFAKTMHVMSSPGGNYKVRLFTSARREGEDFWREREELSVVQDTAPLAICLAALKAKGVIDG